MKAIVVARLGGPEVLELAEVPAPEAGPGDVVCDVHLAGVNFADTHLVDGTYLVHQRLPFTPGRQFVGRAPDGRRVAATVPEGAYAERILVHESELWPVPDAVADADAVAIAVHGAAAWQLLRNAGRLQKGESVVVQAGAGGVGSFAVQLARRWGAGRVIATASTEAKRALALDLGADAAVDSTSPELMAALLEANGGRPVDLVLDMTGGAVFDQCLMTLGRGGRIVTYGTASRETATPIQPESLMDGARSVIGYWLRRPPLETLSALAAMLARGDLKPVIGARYPLADAGAAHQDLLARSTVGVQLLEARP
jgi:NADPH2:quinone reductase